MTREEAIKVLNSSLELSYFDITKEALTMAIEVLEQPEQKKGKWITKKVAMSDSVECSCCRLHYDSWARGFRYCPNCGAEMEVE